MRLARRAALVLALGLAARASGEDSADFTHFVALGDGLTAGFADGNLCEGSDSVPFARFGQRDSWAGEVARALGTEAALPLVAFPGRAGRQLTLRDPARCRYEPELFIAPTRQGGGGRVDPSVRATVVAVPFQTVGDAIEKRWNLDPAVPSSADTDEDMILGLPWAAEGAPPRSQLETAVALDPTFAVVWLGTEDLLRVARSGEDEGATGPAEFETRIDKVVADLSAAGACGAIANVPDPTTFPYFVPHEALRTVLTEQNHGEEVPHAALRILFGLPNGAYLLGDELSLHLVDDISHGVARAPLKDDHVLRRGETRRLRATARAYNAAIARVAERHGWALVDVASLFRAWRRDGVDVGGRRLTTAALGGLFDLTGDSLSPTGHALVAAEFLRAIDARFGTSHVAPDAAAVLAQDPFAPCDAR